MNFQYGALALIASFVSILIGAAVLAPPAAGTAAPRATLHGAEPLLLSAGLLPMAVETAPLSAGDLVQFDVASGSEGPSAQRLEETFGILDYSLDKLADGDGAVPRLFLASLPGDLADVPENAERKAIFFRSVLPLVLQVNEEILAERRRLWRLSHAQRTGVKPAAADRLWLEVMAERYRVKRGDIGALLGRIDIVPPSLALAQAAEESGWGTSRFVKEGNAIFGQWTFNTAEGLVPADRDEGKTHRVKAFSSLIDSVRAYAFNLNTHRAYRAFRTTRADLRHKGKPLDGTVLAGRLTAYSERGPAYVGTLLGLIESNRLRRLDDARLAERDAIVDLKDLSRPTI